MKIFKGECLKTFNQQELRNQISRVVYVFLYFMRKN